MNNPRTEDGLLRTDACFDRHSLPRKFQNDERETESFSAGERAEAKEQDHLALLATHKQAGKYIPRYNSIYLRVMAEGQLETKADFENMCNSMPF